MPKAQHMSSQKTAEDIETIRNLTVKDLFKETIGSGMMYGLHTALGNESEAQENYNAMMNPSKGTKLVEGIAGSMVKDAALGKFLDAASQTPSGKMVLEAYPVMLATAMGPVVKANTETIVKGINTIGGLTVPSVAKGTLETVEAVQSGADDDPNGDESPNHEESTGRGMFTTATDTGGKAAQKITNDRYLSTPLGGIINIITSYLQNRRGDVDENGEW